MLLQFILIQSLTWVFNVGNSSMLSICTLLTEQVQCNNSRTGKFLFLGRPYSFQWNKWWRSYKCIVLALSVEYCEPTLLIKDFYQVQLVAGWPCREVMQGVLWYPHIRYRQECWWYHPALHQLSRRKVKPGTMSWPLEGSTPGNGWFKQTFQFPIKDARLQNM